MFLILSFLMTYHVLNMLACLKESLGFFKFFTEIDSLKQKGAFLENITPSQLRALSEVCNHLLTNHCKLEKAREESLYFKESCDKR